MLLSQLLGERYKEKPSDATLASYIYLLRGGYIRQVSNGIFSLLPPAKRVSQKIEKIIREEMDRVGGQEVLFPVVLPADLWQESGRFESVGSELLRFKDRFGRDMLLGMTHEEAAVHLARSEAKSYLKYPFMIYQIQTKFGTSPVPASKPDPGAGIHYEGCLFLPHLPGGFAALLRYCTRRICPYL